MLETITTFSAIKSHIIIEALISILILISLLLVIDRYRLNGQTRILKFWIYGYLTLFINNLLHVIHFYSGLELGHSFGFHWACSSGAFSMILISFYGFVVSSGFIKMSEKFDLPFSILILISVWTLYPPERLQVWIFHNFYDLIISFLFFIMVIFMIYSRKLFLLTPILFNYFIALMSISYLFMAISQIHDFMFFLGLLTKLSAHFFSLILLFMEVISIKEHGSYTNFIRKKEEYFFSERLNKLDKTIAETKKIIQEMK